MKKFVKILLRVLLVIVLVLLLLAGGIFVGYKQMMKIDQVKQKDASLKNAILYTVDGKDLLYNVIYYGNVEKATISDQTGSGIDTVEELKAILGSADAPAEEFTTAPGDRTLGKAVTADLQTDSKGNIVSVEVVAVNDRPVIGISWKKDEVSNDYTRFASSIERNGGIAVYLPNATGEESARFILGELDGIFFTGGSDWNPATYGQEAIPHGAKNWNDVRDTSDLNLMRAAIAMDVPLLAVCRGAQGLNIALGGQLIQDVPYYLGTKVLDGTIAEDRVSKVMSGTLPSGKSGGSCDCEGEEHLRVQVDGLGHSGLSFYHDLAQGTDGMGISPESKWLYPIFDAASLPSIATAHHQALDPENLGDGLTVVAASSDGIIEAVEYQANHFALALQWHPERDSLGDIRLTDVDQDASNAVLRTFVDHAAQYAD